MNSGIDIKSLRKAQMSGKTDKTTVGEKASDGGKKDFWAFLNRDISFGSGIPDKIKESFYLELSSLLDAGVDIRSALELIGDNQGKAKYKQVFKRVLDRVITGAPFSLALEETGKFTAYEYFSVRIGEETGKLTLVLKELAVFFKKKIKQRRQIIEALTYPCIVLVVAFLSVGFMMTYVVPMFSDVFRRFGGDLPLPTKLVVAASAILTKYAGFVFLLLLSIAGIAFSQRKKQWFRGFASALSLKIPVIRTILSKVYLSRFSNTMALLVGSKIPILQALQMTRRMIGFYPIEISLDVIGEKVMAGMPLHKALSEHSIYPRKMLAMLKVGEDVNQLDSFFRTIADQYADEVEYQAAVLGKFIEPLIIVVLGLVVGVILVAMYLPLFKLGQTV